MILKQGFNRVAALPIPQLRGDVIWDSAIPALGLCACRCPRKRGIIRLAKMSAIISDISVCDPTIRQLGFDLRRQQWSLLNCFCTEQRHCGACRRKWRLTDLCPCGETQTMSHIVESCPATKLNGGLSRLHSADEDTVSWLTNYGSWHAYKKKKWY